MNLLKTSIFVAVTGICVFVVMSLSDRSSTEEKPETVINVNRPETSVPPTFSSDMPKSNQDTPPKLGADSIPPQPELNNNQTIVRRLPVFDSPEQEQLMYKRAQDIQEALDSGDWERFLALNGSLFELSPELMSLAILQAITANAPLSVIEELIFAGGEIPKQAISVLAIKRNVELANALIPYGLDLYYVDDQQRNGYYFASMANSNNSEFLLFLARNNVPFVYPEIGDDALSLLIRNASITKPSTAITTVVKFGHRITNKHLQLMHELRNKNKALYDYVVAAAPELNEAWAESGS